MTSLNHSLETHHLLNPCSHGSSTNRHYGSSSKQEAQVSQLKSLFNTSSRELTHTCLRFGDIETVILVVGPQEVKYSVHEDQLITRSFFFRCSFREDLFKEGSELRMKLPEDDADTCDLFFQWLYWGVRPLLTLEKLTDNEEILMQSVKLYVLAGKYDIYGLMEDLMDGFVKAIKNQPEYAPSLDIISYAYGNEITHLPALMGDWVAWQKGEDWFQDDDVEIRFPQMPEFAADLVIMLRRLMKPSAPKDFPFTTADYC